MVRSPESGPNAAPYWYVRVLGVHHATISTTHPLVEVKQQIPQQMEFLWVRWFASELNQITTLGFVNVGCLKLALSSHPMSLHLVS